MEETMGEVAPPHENYMQAVNDIAPVAVVVLPVGHEVQVEAPVAVLYFPMAHGVQLLTPGMGLILTAFQYVVFV